jgi:hypothetical protein
MTVSDDIEDQASVRHAEAPAELGNDLQFHLPGLRATELDEPLTEETLELVRSGRQRPATGFENERNIRLYDCPSLPVSRRNHQQGQDADGDEMLSRYP